MLDMAILDALGRTPIAEDVKARITEAFTVLTPDQRGAILIMADHERTQAYLAARYGSHWKVAGGAGWTWGETRPAGWIAVECAW